MKVTGFENLTQIEANYILAQHGAGKDRFKATTNAFENDTLAVGYNELDCKKGYIVTPSRNNRVAVITIEAEDNEKVSDIVTQLLEEAGWLTKKVN